MTRILRLTGLLCCAFILESAADLSLPASFEVVEEQRGQFRMTLSVPLVNGRYMNLTPIVPRGFQSRGEPETRAGAASLTRQWHIEADRESIYNDMFGLDGLLGTSAEVRFLLTTRDGRRFETVLRPSRSVFRVPEPERPGTLAAQAVRDGLRRAVRSGGLWVGLACILFSGLAPRRKAGGILIIVVLLGFRALSMTVPPAGLSNRETGLTAGFLVTGYLAGVAGLVVALGLAGSLVADRVRSRIWMYSWVLASAWMFYQGAGLIHHYGPFWQDNLMRLAGSLSRHWFSPFASDWAMARLRIPWLSLAVLALIVPAMMKIRHRYPRRMVSGCLLAATFVLLPYGVVKARVPFMKPRAPSAKQANRIIAPMLSGIYRALNLEDEEQTYDRLAGRVAGNLITDLYLDSRRRLATGIREGASVVVKQVDVASVTPLPTGPGFHVYQCEWVVTARVTHWQHSHERRNVYEGNLGLVVEEGAWKLAALNLQSEERTVVPGSFSSR